MDETIEVISELPQLRDPVLIAGLAVRRRGGRLPSQTLSYLIDAWDARLVARIDADDFLDFTVRRPEVRYEGDERIIDPPESKIYLAQPPGANRDFIILNGFEPNWRWRVYTNAIVDYADAAGVKTLVSLRCFPGQVPHTRPSPVTINASDVNLELQFGVQAATMRYEGPTDVMGVLAAGGQAKRWQTVDLTVLQPYYYPRLPNAKAQLGLIRAIDRAFGVSTPLESLEVDARAQVKLIDESMTSNVEEAAALHELEEAYDRGLERMDFLATDDPPAELPSGQDVVREIERLFREGTSSEEQT
jgi:proteasome assembly chaperone (PAC2) family protein